MKLLTEIGGEAAAVVEFRREGERVFAEVEGRVYELEARAVGAGEYLLLHEGRVYECRMAPGAQSGGSLRVSVGHTEYEVSITDPKRLRGAGGQSGADSGRAQVRAPMPGKVVRVLAEQGQQVEAGQGLVVVEAMKMQNELKSPKAGTLVDLRAEAGSTVNAGDVLAVVE
jgi:biotin carboxyl carrier protein